MTAKKNTKGFYSRYNVSCIAILFLLGCTTTTTYAQLPVSEQGNSSTGKYTEVVRQSFPALLGASTGGSFFGQSEIFPLKNNAHFYDGSGDDLSAIKEYNKNENATLSAFAVAGSYSVKSVTLGRWDTTTLVKDTVPAVDLTDVLKKIFNKKIDTIKTKKSGGVAILPTFGYNPSLGFQIGAKVSADKYLGDPKNTSASVFGLIGVYTSKGILNIQAIHNLFTPENKMNWQGNWQLTLFAIDDYGIGTGKGYPDSVDFIKYKFLRFFEKAYVRVAPHLFVGGGLNFNIRIDIDDRNQSPTYNTAHQTYSVENGFNPLKYSANGIIGAIQYITRENPIRSYGGVYADMSWLVNQEWLGSAKNALQMQIDFRKYWSLSKRRPSHVLAIWNLASYKFGGSLPYLELPTTANDAYARSGRGYTIGRFKGPSYFYFETEYRFPITRNQLISGVCFINTQSASDKVNNGLFNSWATAGGGGLRVLFQKQSRSTICFDYAVGQYGSKGFFIGLNEAF